MAGIGYRRRMRTAILVLSVVALVAGCKKGEDKKEPAGDDKGKAPDKAPADAAAKETAPDFSAWNPDEKQKAWQGSWLVKENGKIQAWTVDGTEVMSSDGEKDETFTLELEAPCRAYFKNDKGMMFPRNFTVVDGAVQYRGGGAGYRKDSEAIYCDASSAIYVLDGAGKCTIWEKKMGKWETRDGECGIKQTDAGAEVFHHADPNGGEFEIKDGAILSKTSFPTEKVEGDHEAAKKARDAKAAEK